MRGMILLLATAGLWAQDLDRVAQVASVMVDGDVCRRIQTPRSARVDVEEGPAGPLEGQR